MIVAAWLTALGIAVIAELVSGRSSPGGVVELSLMSLSRTISSEAGVIRIRAEMISGSYLLVVECFEPPEEIPGEVDGIPVRVRIASSGSELSPEEASARELARMFPGFFLPQKDGDAIDLVVPDGGAYRLLTDAFTPSLEKILSSMPAERGVEIQAKKTPAGLTEILFRRE